MHILHKSFQESFHESCPRFPRLKIFRKHDGLLCIRHLTKPNWILFCASQFNSDTFIVNWKEFEFERWQVPLQPMLTLLLQVNRCEDHTTYLPMEQQYLENDKSKHYILIFFFKEYSISFLMIFRLIDVGLVVLYLLIFKMSGIIETLKNVFFNFSGTESWKNLKKLKIIQNLLIL